MRDCVPLSDGVWVASRAESGLQEVPVPGAIPAGSFTELIDQT